MRSITNVETREIYVVTVGEVGPRGEPGAPGASSGDASNIVSVQSSDSVILPRCTPVSMVGGLVQRASSVSSNNVYGLVYDATIQPGGAGSVITGSVMTATTDEWDIVLNTSGGLAPGSAYYLSPTLGRLTLTPDHTSGISVLIGFALSSTKMRLFIGNPIIL